MRLIRKIAYVLMLLVFCYSAQSQVEDVPITHPVYKFLIHLEARGLLEHFSTSSLPLQKNEIIEALKKLREKYEQLGSQEMSGLKYFEKEFEIDPRQNAVVFYSSSDSNEVLSSDLFSNKEKLIYHYRDSSNTISISPLGMAGAMYSKNDNGSKHVLLGSLGVRLFGTLSKQFGYYLQATNGTIINGDRSLALKDKQLQQNIKFADLNSDFDFSESHVIYQQDWFYAKIGRESLLIGSGINQNMYVSTNAPPMDAISLGAKFSNFEYRFTHAGLLSLPNAKLENGFNADIPQKYFVSHRFALKPSWGEIAYWESVFYSRPVDFGYLNPLIFLKSEEHALHDRDNSMMGGDLTIRPIKNIELKGTFILDDMVFSKIGKNYWSNKTALCIGAMAALPLAFDIGIEYARVEPYTFTHFDSLNSYSNDNMLIGSYLLPNSDETSILMRWWFMERYPIECKISYQRHGANVVDSAGTLIKNVGSDPLQTKRPEDSEYVKFLDGTKQDFFLMEIRAGWEIIRGFNIKAVYTLRSENNKYTNFLSLKFSFEDF
jgi:hypothetical protein